MNSSRFSFRPYLLYLVWIVAVVATLGSLYFSEVMKYAPCELCWYQRILMYPLSLILGIAAYNGDLAVRKYVLPLAIVGGSISLYHYLLQKVPNFAEIKPCSNGIPCNVDYIDWLGFITIPFLALTAFTLIIIGLLLIKPSAKSD